MARLNQKRFVTNLKNGSKSKFRIESKISLSVCFISGINAPIPFMLATPVNNMVVF